MTKKAATPPPATKPPKKRSTAPVQCYKCPRDHPGYPRSTLKNRRGVPYCPAHLKEYDSKRPPPWPSCPRCGENDCWFFTWAGLEKTQVECTACGLIARALDHFDALTVATIARPIERY